MPTYGLYLSTLVHEFIGIYVRKLSKIYSLHETDAYAVNKGKDHKGYEYGTKASIVTTKDSGIIVGVAAHKENGHDSKTLELALENTIDILQNSNKRH